MLQQLHASDERFKNVNFKPGLNLIVADTTSKSTETDTRNGVGKSSLIEILHFLLGAKVGRSTFLGRKELRSIEFRLTMDWPASPTGMLQISRVPERANDIYLDPDITSQAQASLEIMPARTSLPIGSGLLNEICSGWLGSMTV